MAIALDLAKTSGDKNSSPFTWTHTCTGSNGLLIVCVYVWGNSQPTVSAVTYNSVSMVKARADQKAGISSYVESSIWFLYAPATGSAYTISVTASSLVEGGGTSVSYTGAQQSNTPDAVNGLTGTTSGAQSFNVTTLANNCWVASSVSLAGVSPAVTATQTTRGTLTGAAMAGGGEDTNAPKTPAGAQTMGWTIGGTPLVWAMTGASFAPSGGATTSTSSSSSSSSTVSTSSSSSSHSTSSSSSSSVSTSSSSSTKSTSSSSSTSSKSTSSSSSSISTSSSSSSVSTSSSSSTVSTSSSSSTHSTSSSSSSVSTSSSTSSTTCLGTGVELWNTILRTDANIVSYWRFNESSGGTTVSDSVDSNPGTASETSILGTAGKFGNCGTFASASSDKVTIVDASSLKPTGNFTINAWFKTSTTGAYQNIFWSGAEAGSKWGEICLRVRGATNTLDFVSGKNTGTVLNTDYQEIIGGTTVTNGAWHMATAIWDGSYLRLYLDGNSDATAVAWANAPAYQATNYIRIGNKYGTGEADYFNGSLDDVSFFSRALSASEVSNLYCGTEPTTSTSSSSSSSSVSTSSSSSSSVSTSSSSSTVSTSSTSSSSVSTSSSSTTVSTSSSSSTHSTSSSSSSSVSTSSSSSTHSTSSSSSTVSTTSSSSSSSISTSSSSISTSSSSVSTSSSSSTHSTSSSSSSSVSTSSSSSSVSTSSSSSTHSTSSSSSSSISTSSSSSSSSVSTSSTSSSTSSSSSSITLPGIPHVKIGEIEKSLTNVGKIYVNVGIQELQQELNKAGNYPIVNKVKSIIKPLWK